MASDTKLSFKLWNMCRDICVKLGLWQFGHNVYTLWVQFTMIKFNRDMNKRRNGWNDPRYVKLRQFENIHKGKRCFIVCTGPSLTVEDVNKLKENNEICLSMNSIVNLLDKTDWRPSYYVVLDPWVFELFLNNPIMDDLKVKFFGDKMSNVANLCENDMMLPTNLLEFLKKGYPKSFSDNIYNVVYGGASVTYACMQIAAYMGFSEVYLLGCDCNYSGSKKHFDDKGYEYANEKMDAEGSVEDNMIKTYQSAQAYCETHENFQIYNATRGGMLEVFPRVGFDSLFDNKS